MPLSDVEKSRLAKQGPIRVQFFYSRDSEPCRRAARLILDYEKAFPKLFEVERIDVSDNPESAVRNNISAVPTMVFFHDDRRIHKTTGVMDLDELQEFIARFARSQRHDASETSSPPELRYDGKTFDQWRRVWNVDGMANSKLEALAALEAFARAGFGGKRRRQSLTASIRTRESSRSRLENV